MLTTSSARFQFFEEDSLHFMSLCDVSNIGSENKSCKEVFKAKLVDHALSTDFKAKHFVGSLFYDFWILNIF
jgi:hypothetical protein